MTAPETPATIGLLGCEAEARVNWAPYLEQAGVRILLWDAKEALAHELAAEIGGESFGSVDDLLAAGADACVVTTTVTTRFNLIKHLLEEGRHVVSVAPLASTLDHARELERLATERGLVLAAAHPQLLMLEPQLGLVDEGLLGELRAFRYRWRTRKRDHRDLVTVHGHDAFAVLLEVVPYGELKSIRATTPSTLRIIRVDADPRVAIEIQFESGAGLRQLHVRDLPELELRGTRGELAGVMRSQLTPDGRGVDYRFKLRNAETKGRLRLLDPLEPYETTLRRQVALALESFRAGSLLGPGERPRLPVGARRALEVQALRHAALESAGRLGRPVKLPVLS